MRVKVQKHRNTKTWEAHLLCTHLEGYQALNDRDPNDDSEVARYESSMRTYALLRPNIKSQWMRVDVNRNVLRASMAFHATSHGTEAGRLQRC